MKYYLLILSLLVINSSTFAYEHVKTSEELRTQFPNITENSTRPENKKILCPFHRMLERAGLYDEKVKSNSPEIFVDIPTISSAAQTFGCQKEGCGPIALIASLGQLSYPRDVTEGKVKWGQVNITRLYHARGLAHDCGLTFAKGGKEINDEVRAKTLQHLKDISSAVAPYTLSLDALMYVKKEICAEQGVEITKAGIVEVNLIYEYLGGKERGFVEYGDVEKFLNAEMPLFKSSKEVGVDAIKNH